MNYSPAQIHHETRSIGDASRVCRSASLQAKGSCWYCDKPVDNVRRFCSLSCRDDYFEEENEMFS
jgi:hypothetical protein